MIFDKWIHRLLNRPKPLTASFYMRGGQIITIGNVKKVEMTREGSTGQYSAYSSEWTNPKLAPNMFTMSIPDIIAVVAVEEK